MKRALPVRLLLRWVLLGASAYRDARVSRHQQAWVEDLLSASADGHRFEYAADSASYSLQTRTQHFVPSVAAEAYAIPEHAEMLARLGARGTRTVVMRDRAIRVREAGGL